MGLLLCNRCVEVHRRALLVTRRNALPQTELTIPKEQFLTYKLSGASETAIHLIKMRVRCTCVWEERRGGRGGAGGSPVLRLLLVEARGLRPGQLAQRLIRRFGETLRGGQRVAGGVAEQDRRRQGRGEEDVSVVLGVLGCGRGVAHRLLETEGERRA